jgi:putative ABC transport system permease protein
MIRLPTPQGPWELEVAGVYADYGNPKGQVRVALAPFTERFPDAPRQSFGLRVDPGAVPALIADMRERFGLDADRLRDQTSLKAVSSRIFERTFAVTAALNALTLGVAGVALLTSLVTLSGLRLPQIAPVWAIGMTQARLGLIELGKMLMLALLTALCAVPLGLGIAWVLLAVVNVEAFGWRLPLHLFPGQWGALIALAVVTACAAAAWPIWRIARMPPARLIQVFAGAR